MRTVSPDLRPLPPGTGRPSGPIPQQRLQLRPEDPRYYLAIGEAAISVSLNGLDRPSRLIRHGYPAPTPGVTTPQLMTYPIGYQRGFVAPRVPVASQLVKRMHLKGKAGTPRCLQWRPEGDRLLCGLASGEVAAFNSVTLDCDDLKRILEANGDITAVAALRSCDSIIFGDVSGRLHFASRNFAPIKHINLFSQTTAVQTVDPSPTEGAAVVLVKSQAPALVDLQRHYTIGTFSGLGFETSCVNWHPRRNLIVAGSRTHQLQLWDINSARPESSSESTRPPVATSFAHRGSINAVRWHPYNDFYFLSCGRDQLICLWDIRRPTGSDTSWNPIEVYKAEVEYARKGAVARVPLAFESHLPLDASGARCSDCFQSRLAPLFKRHTEYDRTRVYPTCLEWHPIDGGLFAVGDSMGLITFWKDAEIVCRVDQTAARSNSGWTACTAVEGLQWHPSGTLLASASGAMSGINGSVNFWRQPDIWSSLCDPATCANEEHLTPSNAAPKAAGATSKVLKTWKDSGRVGFDAQSILAGVETPEPPLPAEPVAEVPPAESMVPSVAIVEEGYRPDPETSSDED